MESSVLLSMRLLQSSKSKVLREKVGQQRAGAVLPSVQAALSTGARICWGTQTSPFPKRAPPNQTPKEPASAFSFKRQNVNIVLSLKNGNQNINVIYTGAAAAMKTQGMHQEHRRPCQAGGRAKHGRIRQHASGQHPAASPGALVTSVSALSTLRMTPGAL